MRVDLDAENELSKSKISPHHFKRMTTYFEEAVSHLPTDLQVEFMQVIS